MSLLFKDSKGTIHRMNGGGGSGTVDASTIEEMYPILKSLIVEDGELIFNKHKVSVTNELSNSEQAIEDISNGNFQQDPDYVPDENDESINSWFDENNTDGGDDSTTPDPSGNEDIDNMFNNNDDTDSNTNFDDLFNGDSTDDSSENEFDDLFNGNGDESDSESNSFDDIFGF